ncbi:MAG: hypothetical protein NWR21_09855 [Verrucomicrobiales bacterium]|nr:hypothetical protein [Verrucomicrobiales bacterium]
MLRIGCAASVAEKADFSSAFKTRDGLLAHRGDDVRALIPKTRHGRGMIGKGFLNEFGGRHGWG